jgi:hypothetical protein
MNEFSSSLSSFLGYQKEQSLWPIQQQRGSRRNRNNDDHNEEHQKVSLIQNNVQSNTISNKSVIDKLSADNEDFIKVCAAKEENDTESTFYYLFFINIIWSDRYICNIIL